MPSSLQVDASRLRKQERRRFLTHFNVVENAFDLSIVAATCVAIVLVSWLVSVVG